MAYIESGTKCGKWTVLRPDPDRPYYYICRCECGKVQSQQDGNLLNATPNRQCRECFGRSRMKPLDRSQFGNWTVLRYEFVGGKHKYLCRCVCGSERYWSRCSLTTGKTTGCRRCQGQRYSGQGNPRWRGYGGIPLSHWNRIVRNASASGREVCITIEDAWRRFEEQKGLCALTGLGLNFAKRGTASLDRIDSNGDYTLGNIQWVHKAVNSLKSNFPEDELVYWCRLIVTHHDKKPKVNGEVKDALATAA